MGCIARRIGGLKMKKESSGKGFGYLPANTTVTFGAPAGGVAATGAPVITAGVVTAINMTAWGQGYTSRPSIRFQIDARPHRRKHETNKASAKNIPRS
jgi:hypothetical protein